MAMIFLGKLCRWRPWFLKDLVHLRRKLLGASMDLIAIFPRVRIKNRCILPEDSDSDPVLISKPVRVDEPVTRAHSSLKRDEFEKQYDAAWLAGFQAESSTGKVSSCSEVCHKEQPSRGGSRAVQEKQLPEPDTCQISTQKAKELDSARTKEKHHPKQRVKEKSRRNIPLTRLYQPSLTLWFLSFIASIIWLCVFYVERQPIQHREEERLDRVRFAEMTELLPEPGKSRQ